MIQARESQKDTAQVCRVEKDNRVLAPEKGTQGPEPDKGCSRTDRTMIGSNHTAGAPMPRERQRGLVDQGHHMQPDGGRIARNLWHGQ